MLVVNLKNEMKKVKMTYENITHVIHITRQLPVSWRSLKSDLIRSTTEVIARLTRLLLMTWHKSIYNLYFITWLELTHWISHWYWHEGPLLYISYNKYIMLFIWWSRAKCAPTLVGREYILTKQPVRASVIGHRVSLMSDVISPRVTNSTEH